MPAWPVDGMDIEAVVDSTDRALTSIRAGSGPVFLEFQTYRFRAHSMYDPELYRDKTEVASWHEHDPIHTLFDRMVADGQIEPDGLPAIEAEVDAEIELAVDFADASPIETSATLEQARLRSHLGGGRTMSTDNETVQMTGREAIREAIVKRCCPTTACS